MMYLNGIHSNLKGNKISDGVLELLGVDLASGVITINEINGITPEVEKWLTDIEKYCNRPFYNLVFELFNGSNLEKILKIRQYNFENWNDVVSSTTMDKINKIQISKSHLEDYKKYIRENKQGLVNLTPHDINIEGMNPIPSHGLVRANERITTHSSFYGVNIIKKEYGSVEGLPHPRYGTKYIVSLLVAQICYNRHDLLVPGQTILNQKGQVIGCKNLAVI